MHIYVYVNNDMICILYNIYKYVNEYLFLKKVKNIFCAKLTVLKFESI